MIDLGPIRKRLRKASAGPWEWWTSCSFRRLSGPDGKDGGVLRAVVYHDGVAGIEGSEGDMDFVAHAREDVENLVREVEYLRMKAAEWSAQF